MQKIVGLLRFVGIASLLAACGAQPLGFQPGEGDDDDSEEAKSKSTDADDDDDTSGKHGDDDDDDGHGTKGDGAGDDDGAATPATTKTVPDEPDPKVDTSKLDPFFLDQMDAANIPGMGVAVVRDGHLKWTKGYGLMDISKNKPVTRDTLFMLASVSKTVTTACLMQLIEDPKNGMNLDDDVSTKVGFKVRNPNSSGTKITYRMLLTHTSSLIDGPHYTVTFSKGDFPKSLEAFEKESIADEASWQSNKPGSKFEYSNTGIALAGLVVEKVSKQDLQSYAKSHIFTPLGMKETSYFFKDLDASHIAQPYNGTNLSPQGFYGYPDYPSGQIRTSAPQLAKFLEMISSGGAIGDVRLLKSETVKQMMTPQIPNIEAGQGLTFFSETKGGKKVMGHNGDDKGVSTEMFFDPKTKAGYVILMNARDQLDDIDSADEAISNMTDKLMDLAISLP